MLDTQEALAISALADGLLGFDSADLSEALRRRQPLVTLSVRRPPLGFHQDSQRSGTPRAVAQVKREHV